MIAYTPPIRSDRLPVVDLAPSFADSAGRFAVASEIRTAVRDTGFFYVRNHGVESSVVDAAMVQAQRFLTLPLSVKERYPRGNGRRGYEGIGGQATGATLAPAGAQLAGDLKDSFNFGRPRGPVTPAFQENQWPDGLPGFRDAVEAYYTAIDGLPVQLMRLLAISLDLPESFFDDALRFPDASCRLLRYPPQTGNAGPNQMGAGAHTDIGAITILAQDDHEALEVRTPGGQWIRALPIDGTFVVNIGDLMMRWTNDRYVSSMHRVMNNTSDEDRYSIVFFFSPAYDTRVACVPTCASPDMPAKYEPVVSGEYCAARLATSRAFRRE